uniref:Uncharacterized protein n=1 Tax=Leersia perrieri TaxID=77586 RepID=A0A0D9XYS6_9ORYZ
MVLKQGTTTGAAVHRVVVFLLLLLLLVAFNAAVAYQPFNENKPACYPRCPAPGDHYSRGCDRRFYCH